jgi:hypothetical protein
MVEKALRKFSQGKEQVALAIAIKYKLYDTPFLAAHMCKGFVRIKDTLLVDNPDHYGMFWLIGKEKPTIKRAATEREAAEIMEIRPELKIVGRDDHFIPIRLNDPSIPQIPVRLLYKFSQYVASNWK